MKRFTRNLKLLSKKKIIVFFIFICLFFINNDVFAGGGGVPCHCLTAGVCVQAANCGNPAENACLLGGGTWFFQQPCAIPMPVELTSFSYEIIGNEIEINFETASERDLDYYVIENSKNGSYWQEIGNLKAAGNSTSKSTYKLVDKSPFIGNSYYRLKNITIDGAVNNMDIITCEFTSAKYLIYPIPVNKLMFIEGDKLESSNLFLVNSLGENVEVEMALVGNKYSFNFENVKNGVYFLKIENASTKRTERIVVFHK